MTVDVRGIAPRDRLGVILGSWDALAPGAAMDLWVDHDPRCMYYTLQAMHGDEAFTFEYLLSGPDDWRVRVTRR
jgi:uncharacterized protein (DUF2249 family)